MKHVPATIRPSQPARRNPRWIASSVELGPGIRFVAPTRSRNSERDTQPRRVTTSSSIIAIWAAGPPKAVVPRRRNTRATSPRAFGTGLLSPKLRRSGRRRYDPFVQCPYCTGDSSVTETRVTADGLRRRRMCAVCKRRFTTYEKLGAPGLKVQKRDGSLERVE